MHAFAASDAGKGRGNVLKRELLCGHIEVDSGGFLGVVKDPLT